MVIIAVLRIKERQQFKLNELMINNCYTIQWARVNTFIYICLVIVRIITQ